MNKKYYYYGNCVSLSGHRIIEMVDNAKPVTLKTIRKHCDGVDDWAVSAGYAVGNNKGLHMKDDYAISYYKSKYCGTPCYYIYWSSIEHVWLDVPIRLRQNDTVWQLC